MGVTAAMADTAARAVWSAPPKELRRQGACARPSVDPELFFPERGIAGRIKADAARAICAGCPVRRLCRDWALSQPVDRLIGVWGGTSTTERYELNRAARRAAA